MTSPNYTSITLSINNHIAVVALNRPDKLNGLNFLLFKELLHCVRVLKKDKNLRAVIIKGEGASFCAGLDFAEVAKKPAKIAALFAKIPLLQKGNSFQRLCYAWRDLPIPVLAVIHGHCFGGGLQIALGADFRFATPDAQLSIMEMKWGLIPDMGAMAILPSLMSQDKAKELMMTGKIISGEQAKRDGLVTHVSVQPFDDAMTLATTLAAQSPSAVSSAKKLCHRTWFASTRRALFWERVIQLGLLGRKNQRIAMYNNANKQGKIKPFVKR